MGQAAKVDVVSGEGARGSGLVSRVVWALVVALSFAALAALLHHFNTRKLPRIDGPWRVEVAEHLPPLLAGDLPVGLLFKVTRRGEITHVNPRDDRPAVVWGVISRAPCWGDCFTFAWLNNDYRVPAPSRMHFSLTHGPNRMELLGNDGARVVALRPPAGG